jgi:hypothetical protein
MGDMADTLDGMAKKPPLNGIVIDQQDMCAHRKFSPSSFSLWGDNRTTG